MFQHSSLTLPQVKSTKLIHTENDKYPPKKKQQQQIIHINNHQTQIFKELVPSVPPSLRKHTREGHAGIIDQPHCPLMPQR